MYMFSLFVTCNPRWFLFSPTKLRNFTQEFVGIDFLFGIDIKGEYLHGRGGFTSKSEG